MSNESHQSKPHESIKTSTIHQTETAAAIKRRAFTSELSKGKRHNQLNKRRQGITTTATDNNQATTATVTDIPTADILAVISILQNPTNNTAIDRSSAIKQLQSWFSLSNSPISTLINAGSVPLLISILVNNNSLYSIIDQISALNSLSHIAADTYQNTLLVIPIVPIVIQFIQNYINNTNTNNTTANNTELIIQSIWCLSNIAGEDLYCRNQLIQLGILQPIITVFIITLNQYNTSNSNEYLHLLRLLIWCLNNLFKHSIDNNTYSNIITNTNNSNNNNLITALIQCINHIDSELSIESNWLLSVLTNQPIDSNNNQLTPLFISSGLIPQLINRLNTVNQLILTNQFSSNSTNTAPITITASTLLIPLFRTIANITHGPIEYINLLINSNNTTTNNNNRNNNINNSINTTNTNIILTSLRLSIESIHRGLQKESIWCLSNLLANKSELIQLLLLPLSSSTTTITGSNSSSFSLLDLINNLYFTTEFDIQREILHLYYNITVINNGEYLNLILKDQNNSIKLIEIIYRLIRSRDLDSVLISLKLIELILKFDRNGIDLIESSNGIEAIESVQLMYYDQSAASPNSAVDNSINSNSSINQLYHYALNIIDKYWGEEADQQQQQQQQSIEYPAWRLAAANK